MSKIVRVNRVKTDGGQTYIVYIDRGDIQYQKVANMFRKWPTCETIEWSHFECSRPSSTNPFHPRKRPSHWSIPILLLCMWHAVEMSVWCWASLDLCVYLVLSRTLSTKLYRNQPNLFFKKWKTSVFDSHTCFLSLLILCIFSKFKICRWNWIKWVTSIKLWLIFTLLSWLLQTLNMSTTAWYKKIRKKFSSIRYLQLW